MSAGAANIFVVAVTEAGRRADVAVARAGP